MNKYPETEHFSQFHDERRVINKCPKCGCVRYFRKNDSRILCCLNQDCYNEWEGRRKDDDKIKTMADIKNDWGE